MDKLENNASATGSMKKRVKTESHTTIWLGLLMLLGLFAGCGGWLYLAKLSGAVIAQGTVSVQGKPKTVQHLDGGIVAKINVADGDIVKQGETLVSLDRTLLAANLQIYENRLREAVARKARLLAERDDLPEIVWDAEILELLHVEQKKSVRIGHQKLFAARISSREGQIAQLRKQVAQFANQTEGVQALLTSKKNQTVLLDAELTNISDLRQKGLVTNSQVMALERQREDLNGQIGEHDADLARIANSVNEAEIQILQIEREARQRILEELREVEQEVNDTTQRLHATVEQLKRVEIKAPVSGVVHEMNVYTIGGVIGPGDPILQIIPQDEQFVIEAKVLPQFIDELYPSQVATLRFSAFNQRSTPEISGTVDGISANVIIDELSGQSFYKVRLGVSKGEIARLGGQKLISGMPVEAFIRTAERSALNYLLKPLADQLNRAFREE